MKRKLGKKDGRFVVNEVVETRDDGFDGEMDERGYWGSKTEFILSCIGFSVSGSIFIKGAVLVCLFVTTFHDFFSFVKGNKNSKNRF